MQKIIILACAIAASAITSAQKNESFEPSKKVEVIAGETYRESKGMIPSEIWASSESGFYVRKVKLGFGSREIILAHYNRDLNLDFEVELDVEDIEKDRQFFEILEVGKKFIVLSTQKDKKKGTLTLYLNELSATTLTLNPKSTMLGEISGENAKDLRRSGFNTRMSRDSSKFLIEHNLPFTKGEPERFELNVFDDNLTRLWSKSIVLPYNDDLFSINNYRVTNEGDVVVVGNLSRDKADTERKEKNYKTILITYEDQGAVTNEYEINLNGKLVSDINIAMTKEEVICAGFYLTLEKQGIQGSFFVKLDRASKSVIHESTKEFSVEFMKQDLTERQADKLEKKEEAGKDVGLSSNFDLHDFILRNDGGVVMIAEYYKVVRTTTRTQQGTITTYTYHYNDLIVVSIDPKGNIEWASKIPKRQITTNDNGQFSSYLSAVVDDKIYIVFNDNPENLAYNGDGKIDKMRIKDAFASLVTIDSDGRIFREALMSTKVDKVIVQPKLSSQVAEDEVILFAVRGKNKAFYKVKFKK